MRKIFSAGLALFALAVLTLPSQAGGKCGCGGGDCGVADCPEGCGPTHGCINFRIVEEVEKYVDHVCVKNPPKVQEVAKIDKVPCTRQVPVCITDPVTGCTRTEMKEEPYIKLVRTTTLQITPPCEEYTMKDVEKVRTCTKVYFDVQPGCPKPGSCRLCGH